MTRIGRQPTGPGRSSQALGASDPRGRRNVEAFGGDLQFGNGLTVDSADAVAVSVGPGLSFDAQGRLVVGGSGPQTVTGSRSDGTALANLLSALATMGIITDSTTA